MGHLIIAYTIVFGVVLGYVVSLVRRQKAVRRELKALNRAPDRLNNRARGG